MIKNHKKSLIIIDLARSETEQKISYSDLIQVEDLEKELDQNMIKDYHFEKNKENNEMLCFLRFFKISRFSCFFLFFLNFYDFFIFY